MTTVSRGKIISQESAADLTPTNARVTILENNEYKITYYEIISGTSGSVTLPGGATINAGEFGLSGNAILSKIDGTNKPTFQSPLTAGGIIVTASLNVTTGAWVTSGTYTDTNVALIYSIRIKTINYGNLVYNNIVGNPEEIGTEKISNKQNSLTVDGTGTKYPTIDVINANVIKGTLGTTGIGSQIPYNNGVANTVVGSDNFTIYNIGINTAIIMKNPSANGIQELDFYDGSSVSGVAYYGNGYTATQFQGTAISKAQALNIFSGNNFQLPIVFSGTPVVSLAGNTGTNAGTRLDIIGFRIGTLADVNTANTARLEIVAGTNTIPLIKLNSSTPIGTPINGVVEYDATNLMITALGTRQNIMKGLRGTFSASATAQTAFTITFGGTQPNTTYFVAITALNSVTAVNNFIVSRTTTTFTVTYLTGLTGTVNFDWQITQ